MIAVPGLWVEKGYKNNGEIPLYTTLPGKTVPQPAYLGLTEKGVVWLSAYEPTYPDLPRSVCNQREYRWDVPENLTVEGIDTLLGRACPLMKEMLAHHRVITESNGLVGCLDRQGEMLKKQIDHQCESISLVDRYRAQVIDATVWARKNWSRMVKEYQDSQDPEAVIRTWVFEARRWDGVVLHNVSGLAATLSSEAG